VVDCATEGYFREDQQTREDPRKRQVPEVLFRLITQPTKSASENPTRSNEEQAEYQIPNSEVYLRYLKTH
jgi:DNA/RNA endonuclease G (NUC1)